MRIKFLVIAIAIVLLSAGYCKAAEFSADEITQAKFLDFKTKKLMNNIVAFRGKVFVREQMMRREYYKGTRSTKDAKTGKFVELKSKISSKPDAVIINIPEKGYWCKINPQQATYMERRFPSPKNYNPLKGWKYVSNETINGYECKKYTHSTDVGSQKMITLMWWATKLNYAVKTKISLPDGSESTWELKNISLKRIPDSLFQPPKGYKKVPFNPNPPKKREQK